MASLPVAILFLFATTLQASPEPITTVTVQKYEGPVVWHSATCDNQYTNLYNQCKPYNQCDADCSCVTRHSYPYNNQIGSYPTGYGYGYGNQCCNENDVKVYTIVETNYNNGYNTCNRCTNNYQCQCAGYY